MFLDVGGLLFTRDSVNLQYTTTATLVLSIYSKVLKSSGSSGVRCSAATFSPNQISSFATSQVGYNRTLTSFRFLPRWYCSISGTLHVFRWITSWGRTLWACHTW